MDKRLDRFKVMNCDRPVHCLIQCQKLGEGYDQPNISVAGICSGITTMAKFAQFSGRAVRKLDHNNVERELVESISTSRDNVAHIITHSIHNQADHWKTFKTQQGTGGFNFNEDDDDAADADDDATTASEEIPINQRLPG